MHIFTKMATKKKKKKVTGKKGLFRTVEIPEGINVSLDENIIKMSKEGKELVRKLNLIINMKLDGNILSLSTIKSSKSEAKILGTDTAHINNLIKGLNEGFIYELKVSNVHFPITVEHDKNKNQIIIKNFLGEKIPRIAKVLPEVDIKINKDVIELTSSKIENAGQSAANIEKATRIRFKDRRIFQDGIYIIKKPGRVFM